MRFIPKKKEIIVETETNPLETNSVDLSYDERYTQAIMKAVASESGAIVEYEQILALEPNVSKESLVNLFHDTLIDIKNEEIKHLAQLNTQLSKAPSLKNSYEHGKEEANSGIDKSSEEKQEESSNLIESINEIKEAVPQNRSYDSDNIAQLIAGKYQLTDEQYEDILDLLDPLHSDEISAEEVDAGLEQIAIKYEFTREEKDEIENEIIAKASNPMGDRQQEFKDDISFDINTLEDLLDEFNTYAAQQRIKKVIEELKAIEYNGEKDITWNPKYYDYNKHKRGLIQ